MALSKFKPASFDLTDNYAFTGTTTGVTDTNQLVLIKTLTASSSGDLTFVNGASSVVLDNTYKTYLFKFINIHPETDNVDFVINYTTDGTNFNVTQTSTMFAAGHAEDNSATFLEYRTGADVAQGTNPQVAENLGNGNDECFSGELFLFNPSSTTFVKHWQGNTATYNQANYSLNHFSAGYANTTSAVTGVEFKMSSGDIDLGTIKLYGIL